MTSKDCRLLGVDGKSSIVESFHLLGGTSTSALVEAFHRETAKRLSSTNKDSSPPTAELEEKASARSNWNVSRGKDLDIFMRGRYLEVVLTPAFSIGFSFVL